MVPTVNEPVSLLIVDDMAPIRDIVKRVCAVEGYGCFEAANGQEALAVLEKERIHLVLTDVVMPEMDGIALTERIVKDFDASVIFLTGYVDNFNYEDAIEKGASDFVQKPFKIKELTIRIKRVLRERALSHKLQESVRNLQKMLEANIQTIVSTVEVRDPYTSGHQRRVAELALAIGRAMGLPEGQLMGLHMAGVIHDLGKIGIPSEILSKPTRLSAIEFELIKTHARLGYDILKNIPFPRPIADIVHQHHERLDGSGYPRGLTGENILLEARILAVADVVEAMASHRPYRAALGVETALEEITANSGRFYDAGVTAVCVDLFRKDRFSFSSLSGPREPGPSEAGRFLFAAD